MLGRLAEMLSQSSSSYCCCIKTDLIYLVNRSVGKVRVIDSGVIETAWAVLVEEEEGQSAILEFFNAPFPIAFLSGVNNALAFADTAAAVRSRGTGHWSEINVMETNGIEAAAATS